MQIAQEEAGGDNELQILGVGVGLRDRRMVIEHQQNAGDHQDKKGSESQRAQVPGRAEAEHAPPHLGGEKMKEDVLLDSERPVQRAGTGSAAENRAPDA